jgi:hypothetical protein
MACRLRRSSWYGGAQQNIWDDFCKAELFLHVVLGNNICAKEVTRNFAKEITFVMQFEWLAG